MEKPIKIEQLIMAAERCGFERAARSIAHALGTPLNVQLGMVDLTLQGDADVSSAEPCLHKVSEQARNMVQVLRNAVDFTINLADEANQRIGAPAVCDCVRALLPEESKTLKLECRGSVEAVLPAADAVLATFGVAKLGLVYCTTSCVVVIDTSSSCRIWTELPTSARESWLQKRMTEPWLSTDEPHGFADLAFGIACGIARRNEGQARVDSGPEVTRVELTLELS